VLSKEKIAEIGGLMRREGRASRLKHWIGEHCCREANGTGGKEKASSTLGHTRGTFVRPP